MPTPHVPNAAETEAVLVPGCQGAWRAAIRLSQGTVHALAQAHFTQTRPRVLPTWVLLQAPVAHREGCLSPPPHPSFGQGLCATWLDETAGLCILQASSPTSAHRRCGPPTQKSAQSGHRDLSGGGLGVLHTLLGSRRTRLAPGSQPQPPLKDTLSV